MGECVCECVRGGGGGVWFSDPGRTIRTKGEMRGLLRVSSQCVSGRVLHQVVKFTRLSPFPRFSLFFSRVGRA